MILDSHDRVNEPQKRSSASIWNSLEGNAQSMIHRIPFLLMAIVQALFALRCLRNPEAAKAVNVQQGTIWAKLPLSFIAPLECYALALQSCSSIILGGHIETNPVPKMSKRKLSTWRSHTEFLAAQEATLND
jgi:hypothetical protein